MTGPKFAFFALCPAFFLACSDIDVIDPYARAGAPAAPETSSSSSELSSSSVVSSSSYDFSSSSSDEPSSSSNDGSSSSSDDASSSSSDEPSSSSNDGSSSSSSDDASSSSSDDGFLSSSSTQCSGFMDGTMMAHYGKDKAQFCDERDGKKYVYVPIGGKNWMAENLNYEADGSKCVGPDGTTALLDEGGRCNIYGRLYDWATAMNIEDKYNNDNYTVSTKHRGICPPGWHIPSNTEWSALVNYADSTTSGEKLKATNLWNTDSTGYIPGKDIYGFTALPGGNGNAGDAGNVSVSGLWWSATDSSTDATRAWVWRMYYNYNYTIRQSLLKTRLYSIRCIQDGE